MDKNLRERWMETRGKKWDENEEKSVRDLEKERKLTGGVYGCLWVQ